ncbi:MAG: permease-like cell division protein FtsX [Burkholderiales bacterium]|nr:permease-like cell division protein FtsX [Burkholderiales bacterium]
MRAWLLQHARTLFAVFGRLAHSPVASLFNIGVIGIALALPVGFYVGLANLQSFSRELPADPQISLFLALDAGRADVAHIESRLKQHPGVRKFRYVSREQALADIKSSTGLADVVAGLEQNPLPDAFIVDARDNAPQALEKLRDEFMRWPKVAHAQLDAAWAQRLEAVLKLGRQAVLILTTLLAFALVAITFNTIRLQILTRREEIEVAKLIGATNPFIRRPFLYFGALQGLAGGLTAWAIIWVSIYLLNNGLAGLSQLYGTNFQLRHLAPEDSLSLFLFSAWLGWFGAWLSVSRHLSEIEPH